MLFIVNVCVVCEQSSTVWKITFMGNTMMVMALPSVCFCVVLALFILHTIAVATDIISLYYLGFVAY